MDVIPNEIWNCVETDPFLPVVLNGLMSRKSLKVRKLHP